jgi:outer membrane protein OmpA-like peptidoglycan-associated protein
MTQKQITIALCSALALVGCSHSKTPEGTTVAFKEAPKNVEPDARPDTMSGRKAVTTCAYTVRFAPESSVLDRAAEEQLASAAECMKRHDVDQALVVGQKELPRANGRPDELAEERTRAVANYLRELGVPEREIRLRTGEQMATASADSVDVLPGERTKNVTGK